MRYAISICVVKTTDSNVSHSAMVVDAGSSDEATGKGYRIAKKIYPTPEYFQHSVSIMIPDIDKCVPIDPDQDLSNIFKKVN